MHARALKSWAQERGYRIAWGPWGVFQDAWDELSGRRGAGELDETFDREYLAPSNGHLPLPEGLPRWVILVVVPRPAHSVTFTSGGRLFKLLLPPTYIRYNPTRERILRRLCGLRLRRRSGSRTAPGSPQGRGRTIGPHRLREEQRHLRRRLGQLLPARGLFYQRRPVGRCDGAPSPRPHGRLRRLRRMHPILPHGCNPPRPVSPAGRAVHRLPQRESPGTALVDPLLRPPVPHGMPPVPDRVPGERGEAEGGGVGSHSIRRGDPQRSEPGVTRGGPLPNQRGAQARHPRPH